MVEFAKGIVDTCSMRVDIDRAMELVPPDHTSVDSLYRWRDKLYERFGHAVSDFIIDGFDLLKAARAAEKPDPPAEDTP